MSRTGLVSLTAPKTKKAALNQAVYIFRQLASIRRKEKSIMTQVTEVQSKIGKLQGTLEELQNRLKTISTDTVGWKEELKRIQVEFQLTQAEITEEHSRLLQLRIEQLNSDTGAVETGQEIFD